MHPLSIEELHRARAKKPRNIAKELLAGRNNLF